MACFSLAWLESLLIWFVVLITVVAILKLIIPALMSALGAPPGGGAVVTALGYIAWALVAIFAIIVVFDLISCATGGAATGLSLPLRGVR
jgi:hypothetical protein